MYVHWHLTFWTGQRLLVNFPFLRNIYQLNMECRYGKQISLCVSILIKRVISKHCIRILNVIALISFCSVHIMNSFKCEDSNFRSLWKICIFVYPLNRNESGRFGALKSDSTHHFVITLICESMYFYVVYGCDVIHQIYE